MIPIWLLLLLPIFILLAIYFLLKPAHREWVNGYLIPIAFFLGFFLKTLKNALQVLKNKNAKPVFLALTSVNNFFILAFMTLTILSYIIRRKPAQKARGINERVFPLSVVIFHLAGSFVLAVYTKSVFKAWLYVAGFVLSILGITLDCIAMWQIRRSFSIMVEVRTLINTGVYGIIRHPLYAGELLHFLGIALLFNNKYAYIMFLILFVLQTSRALIEERKLALHIPEYAGYMQGTGFFLPRLRKKATRQEDI